MLKKVTLVTLLILAACKVEDSKDEAPPALEPQAPAEAINLVKNPSLEELDGRGAPSAWYVPANFVVKSDGAMDGKTAVQGTPEANFSQGVAVRPNASYSFSFFARSDEPAQKTRLQLIWLDKEGKRTPHIDVKDVSGEWRQLETRATAPPSAATAVIYLHPHTSGPIWYDNVWFGEGTPGD